MYTSFLFIALTVQSIAQGLPTITWSPDYGQARQRGVAESKPVAVILGTGNQGYNQIVGDGGLSQEAHDLLSSKFVCVYIDTTTPQGRKLADAFEMPTGKGIVLSNRQGTHQAFWHEGVLADQALVRQLQQRGEAVSTSNYQPSGVIDGQPAGNSILEPSYCPNCQGGVRYR